MKHLVEEFIVFAGLPFHNSQGLKIHQDRRNSCNSGMFWEKLSRSDEEPKETTLERADFILQLLMFVTAEKEGQLFIIFFLSSFCQLLSPQF